MRTSTVLFTVCLLAASSSAAFEPALPAVTPSVRLERRVVTGNRRLHERSPQLMGGLLGGEDTATGTGVTTGETSSMSTTTSTSTTPTSTSTSTSSSTSTRTTSTSTSSTPTTTVQSTTSSGSVVLVTSTLAAASSTSAAAAQTSTAAADTESSGGGHLGLIIGVSVVGGIALLGALIFLYMKFGGRRFSDYEQDDSDIKWPELKTDENSAAMQPLPARRTGGAGFDMGDDSDNGHEGLMMGAAGAANTAGDSHSMNDYGGKAHDSMLGSSTALHTPGANSGYGNAAGGYGGHMDTVYDEDNPANHYEQPGGVTGYYDPYSNNGGYASHNQQQMFYPEQSGGGGGHEYGGQDYGYGYGQHNGGGYDTNASPPPNPYHMNGSGRNGGY